jgi:hypothetical protein
LQVESPKLPEFGCTIYLAGCGLLLDVTPLEAEDSHRILGAPALSLRLHVYAYSLKLQSDICARACVSAERQRGERWRLFDLMVEGCRAADPRQGSSMMIRQSGALVRSPQGQVIPAENARTPIIYVRGAGGARRAERE